MTNPHPDPSAELASFFDLVERLRNIVANQYTNKPDPDNCGPWYHSALYDFWTRSGVAEKLSLLESQRDEARRKVADLSSRTDNAQLAGYESELAGLRNQLTSLKSTLAETEEENEMLRGKLASDSFDDSIVASCSCLTKTPDIQYHKPGCKYRIIVGRNQALKALAETRAKLKEAESRAIIIHKENEALRLRCAENEGSITPKSEIAHLTAALKTAREALEPLPPKLRNLYMTGTMPQAELNIIRGIIETVTAALSAIRGGEGE